MSVFTIYILLCIHILLIMTVPRAKVSKKRRPSFVVASPTSLRRRTHRYKRYVKNIHWNRMLVGTLSLMIIANPRHVNRCFMSFGIFPKDEIYCLYPIFLRSKYVIICVMGYVSPSNHYLGTEKFAIWRAFLSFISCMPVTSRKNLLSSSSS